MSSLGEKTVIYDLLEVRNPVVLEYAFFKQGNPVLLWRTFLR